MFNVTVLKMKDIIKYIVGITMIIILIIYVTRYWYTKKGNNAKDTKKQIEIENFSFGSLTSCLDKTIPTMSSINKEYEEVENKVEENLSTNYLEEFLKTEISSMKVIEKSEKEISNEDNIIENNNDNIVQEDNQQVTLANIDNIQTEVVTQNPISENFNTQYGKVKIKNQTSYTLSEDMLKPDITIDNKNILIFHTHSCESYTSSEKYPYNPTGNYRTTDLNYTVTRVGTELENYLKQYNLNVIHDTTYHDYPSYNGSYTRSLETVENILKTTSSDIIIDLHRDAIGSREDYAPTVKIGDDYCAQIMFVIRHE